jgi:hypothetical protein
MKIFHQQLKLFIDIRRKKNNTHETKFVKNHEKMTFSDFFIFMFFSTHGAFQEFSSDHLTVLQIFEEYY